MIYYLYEIKNLLNDKIYVGVHKTKNMDDGYMGSGKVILSAIKKYGEEKFTKTILETFENSEAMFAREKEVVTDEFLSRSDTYNLRRGGSGGFDYINANRSRSDRSIAGRKGGSISGPDSIRNTHRKRKENGTYKNYDNPFKNVATQRLLSERARTQQACEKRNGTLAVIKHQQGSTNSQFGSMWITNGIQNTKISKSSPVPEGWGKGRSNPK